jgi:hypothetical protein
LNDVQVLSNTVKAAIISIVDEEQNIFQKFKILKYAKPTAHFCDMMNKCFDSLNKFPIYRKDEQKFDDGFINPKVFLNDDMLQLNILMVSSKQLLVHLHTSKGNINMSVIDIFTSADFLRSLEIVRKKKIK